MAEEVTCPWCGGGLYGAYRVKRKVVCGDCAEAHEHLQEIVRDGPLVVAEIQHDGRAYRIEPPLVLTLSVEHDLTGVGPYLYGIADTEDAHFWYSSTDADCHGVVGESREELIEQVTEGVFSSAEMWEKDSAASDEWWAECYGLRDGATPATKRAETLHALETLRQRVQVVDPVPA